METLDVESLLAEIDPASPCGENLEYDPAFVALEQEVLGKPEVQYGDIVVEAVPPDWKSVRRASLALLARTRDLRLAMSLLQANLCLQGFAGLADALALIEGLLERHWDSVHPQLDPDDDMDPTLRVNSLAMLNDQATILRAVKETDLIVLPTFGPVTLRTLEIASGEIQPAEGKEKIAMPSLISALGDVDRGVLSATLATLGRAYDSVANIEVLLVRAVGNAQALNLDHLLKALRRGREFLQVASVESRNVGAAQGGSGNADAGGAAAGNPSSGNAIAADLPGRDDVLRMLDKIMRYYVQQEPSSPVPILLSRARRLVKKSFMEIMEDLAPDGMAQLLVIRGPDPDADAGAGET